MKPSGDAAARPESNGRGFGRTMRRLLRGALLLLVLLLVACIGLISSRQAPPPPPTATEQSMAEAASAAEGLAVTAGSLARGSNPEDAALYSSLAELFALHAAALQLPASPSPTAPDGEGGTEGSSASTPATPTAAPSAATFLTDLTASYTSAFDASATADPGAARLLASVGTSQWLQARKLAASQELETPAAPVQVLESTENDDGAPCAGTPSAGVEPTLIGIRIAVLAEHRSSYAYEVAAARSAEPDTYLRRAAEHEEAAVVGSALLAAKCSAEPLQPAGSALDAGFLADPDAALNELERGLVRTYTDLVGLTPPGPERVWALGRLAPTALLAASGGERPLGYFPGIDPKQYPSAEPAGS